MDIQLIQGTLQVSDNPGLSPIDERFSDIATLVQDGNYGDAAARCEEILKEEIYDVRIIGYFAYGIFLEKGIGALDEIFRALSGILTENLDAVGPVRNREKHIQTILNWLLRQLVKKTQYEEEREGDLWGLWLSHVSSDQVLAALDAAEGFRRAVTSVLQDKASAVVDSLTKFGKWLSHFQMLVYKKPEPEEEVAETASEPEETAARETASSVQPPAAAAAPSAAGSDAVSVEGAYQLQVLISKIQAFDRLIRGREFSRASLVADDINHIIENFDPRVYFPGLFSRFTIQYAAHINGLSSFDACKNTREWQAMQELYKVDLESFVAFDSSGIEFTTPTPAAVQPSGYEPSGGGGSTYQSVPVEEETGDNGW